MTFRDIIISDEQTPFIINSPLVQTGHSFHSTSSIHFAHPQLFWLLIHLDIARHPITCLSLYKITFPEDGSLNHQHFTAYPRATNWAKGLSCRFSPARSHQDPRQTLLSISSIRKLRAREVKSPSKVAQLVKGRVLFLYPACPCQLEIPGPCSIAIRQMFGVLI